MDPPLHQWARGHAAEGTIHRCSRHSDARLRSEIDPRTPSQPDYTTAPETVMAHRGARCVPRYLAVGGGFGVGLDFAQRAFGWEAHGIDPSPLAREGRRLLGIDIESRYLSAAGSGTGSYDAIAALEVLEHVDKPYEFLSTL